MFLPASPGSLPHPGTPVAQFTATATDGRSVSETDFADNTRVFALLSTGCGDCAKAIAAFREHGPRLSPPPIVGVVGPADDRAPMVAELAGHAIVLEEEDLGPIAAAFEISEFPSVLLIRDGYIQQADHTLAPILATLDSASVPASAGQSH
ncbi:MAG TPA: hypothetical protein VJ851_04245 [Jatrophihabitans sp.]|nr:hypothetical protein [Jatrophihabitans sp.]